MALVLSGGDYLLTGDGGKILLTGDPGAIYHTIAPAWRTADFGNGTASVQWTAPLDPNELKNYTINCATELTGVGSRIASVKLDLSLLATAAGLRIYGMTNDATNVTVWFHLDPAERARPNWKPPGETHALVCTIGALDQHVFQRTVGLPIREVGQ